jgi:uncharacterized protein
MNIILSHIIQALLMSLGMFWEVGWSLVLGFLIAAIVQVYVPREKLQAALGGSGVRPVALAVGLGAISSSCSYASASVTRTLFRKGASLVTSLAFLFASTNLVIELGLILYLLMGWQFMAAEWIGGVVLVIVMSAIVRVTYPRKLVEAARLYAEQSGGKHEHDSHTPPLTPPAGGGEQAVHAENERSMVFVAQHFVMDLGMLWKDLLAGFLIAGFLSVFVPQDVWKMLFVTGANPWLQVPLNALIGPLIAVVSFVCSIGNVPMAAVLWGSGISFGGVLAFLYADLIVLPLLDVYRRYFGWKMAVYIGVVFYITMVLTGIVMDIAFTALGFVPEVHVADHVVHASFSINYTFWLNLTFGAAAVVLFLAARQGIPRPPADCCGHHR